MQDFNIKKIYKENRNQPEKISFDEEKIVSILLSDPFKKS